VSDEIFVRSHVARDLIHSAGLFKNDRLVVWEYVVNGLQYIVPGTKAEVRVTLDSREKKISVDLSALLELLREGLPEDPSAPNQGCGLAVSISETSFEKCCGDTLRTLHRFNGGGSGGCSFQGDSPPLFGIPYIASVHFTYGGSGSISLSINGEETCDGAEVCGNVGLSGSVNGGLSAIVGLGALRAQAVVESSGINATWKWCPGQGFKLDQFCRGDLDAVISLTAMTFVTADVRWTLIKGKCD